MKSSLSTSFLQIRAADDMKRHDDASTARALAEKLGPREFSVAYREDSLVVKPTIPDSADISAVPSHFRGVPVVLTD